jgi:MFS family permease
MYTRITRTVWFMPAFSVALGIAFLIAFWLGDRAGDGAVALALMSALGLLFLLGGRSETIRGLRGDGRDERFGLIDSTATAFMGNFVVAVILVMCLWEFGNGRDGQPYTALGAIAGLSYLAAIAYLRLRK